MKKTKKLISSVEIFMFILSAMCLNLLLRAPATPVNTAIAGFIIVIYIFILIRYIFGLIKIKKREVVELSHSFVETHKAENPKNYKKVKSLKNKDIQS